MQQSGSTTETSSAVSEVTKSVTPEERPALKHTEPTRTKPSKISQITNPLKKASSELNQKLQKLRSRVSKSKAVGEESEKTASGCTSSPKGAEEPTVEDESAVDVEIANKDEAKKAKRDARRAKWAARRYSLKQFGEDLVRKIGKGAAVTGAVILGCIFGPIIVAFELILSLVVIVVGLMLQLLEILFTPCIICFDWY